MDSEEAPLEQNQDEMKLEILPEKLPPSQALAPDYKAISEITHFSKAEIKRMHQRFVSICDPETHLLGKEKFLQQVELTFSPLIAIAYDKELEESPFQEGISFQIFILMLNPFSPKASLDEKKSCELLLIIISTTDSNFHF